jgi:hypothetical protein
MKKMIVLKEYSNELKVLVKAFNKGLIDFDEVCDLNLMDLDKNKIEYLEYLELKRKNKVRLG